MSKIGMGLIGCGARLRQVVKNVLEASDRVEVRALCDPSEHSLSEAKKMLNPAAKVYADYRDLVRAPEIDWVMIGSWNCCHREHAVAAFEAGKHVFCEKPLATTLEDCIAMREAWHKSGKQFQIGFVLRFSPHYQRIKEIIAAGEIGQIVSFEFNETLHFNHGGFIHSDWRRHTEKAGTHLLEKCCHDIDLANWMVGSVATRVASFGGNDFFVPGNVHHIDRIGRGKNGEQSFSWRSPEDCSDPFTADKDIYDNQVGIIEYANGARATFHTNCCAGIPERRMYICGTEGCIRADVLAGRIELQRYGHDAAIEDRSSAASGGHGGGEQNLANSIVASMLENAPPQATLEDGLLSAIICFGMDDAAVLGQVVDMRPYWKKAGIAVEKKRQAICC